MLAFGGPRTFEPSGWEWSFRAGPLIRSDPGRARQILQEGLASRPRSASLHYTLACLEALQDNAGAALASLEQAIALSPAAADWARGDEDFRGLAADPAFRALVGSDQPPSAPPASSA